MMNMQKILKICIILNLIYVEPSLDSDNLC